MDIVQLEQLKKLLNTVMPENFNSNFQEIDEKSRQKP